MTRKKKRKKISEDIGQGTQYNDNPQENLLGVFSILLAVAKRTNPKKYLVGYRKNH